MLRLAEKASPIEQASALSEMFFSWFTPIVRYCYKKNEKQQQLQMNEVPELPAEDMPSVHYLRYTEVYLR